MISKAVKAGDLDFFKNLHLNHELRYVNPENVEVLIKSDSVASTGILRFLLDSQDSIVFDIIEKNLERFLIDCVVPEKFDKFIMIWNRGGNFNLSLPALTRIVSKIAEAEAMEFLLHIGHNHPDSEKFCAAIEEATLQAECNFDGISLYFFYTLP